MKQSPQMEEPPIYTDIQIFFDNGVVVFNSKTNFSMTPHNTCYYTSEPFMCIYLMSVFFLPFIHISLI